MKHFFQFLTLTFYIMFGVKSNAQERYEPTKFIPPSPTAASLGVYGDFPISYYTGTPDIEIPLYEIQSGSITLPITLKYNASGVKVAQDASWVGLGWSLSAGGVVTRNIRGLDDLSDVGYNQTAALPPNDEYNSYQVQYDTPADDAARDYFIDIFEKQIDGEPDIFFYNFPGNSGKFLLGKQVLGDSIYMAERNNLDIKYSDIYTYGANGSWVITNAQGYKYFFGTKEKSEDYYRASEPPSMTGLFSFTPSYKEVVNSWYLDSIVAPGGESIKFYYETGASLSMVNFSQKRYDKIGNGGWSGNVSMSALYNYFNYSRQKIQDVYLRKIEFSNGYLMFNRESRIDIEPYTSGILPSKLSNIEIYTNSNTLVKKIVLGHSYFNNNQSTSFNYSHKRLKLNSVTEYGLNNEAKMPYLFSYDSPDNLPDKYSRQVDEWGFASSFYSPVLPNETKPTLLPKVTINTSLGMTTFDGTARPVDASGSLTKRGILTSITYPTGGRTDFDFEPNTYSNFPSYTVTNQIQLAGAVSHDGDGQQLTGNFDLYSTTSVKVELSTYTIAEETLSPTQIIAYLKNRNTNAIIQSFSLSAPSAVISLSAGQYYVQVDNVLDYHNSIYASYSQSALVNTKVGGGIRIKSIANYDIDGKQLGFKRFKYQSPTTNLSSGTLLLESLKYYTQLVTIRGSGQDYRQGEFLVRSSSSMNPLGFASAVSPVTYSSVQVLEGANGEGGSTHYSYHNSAIATTHLPEMPLNFYALNGKLKTVEVKNHQSALLKKEVYSYTLKESSVLKGVKFRKGYPDNSPYFIYEDDDIKYYDNYSEWYVLSSKEESSYSNNQVLNKVYTYNYDNNLHKEKTFESSAFSDGTSLNVHYKYPHDFQYQAPYNEMVSRNMIAPVIEQQSFIESTPTKASFTEFHKWNGNVIAPSVVKSKKGASAYEIRMRFHAYDSKGNVVSVSKEDDALQSYVWGYNKSFPVIKGENVSSTDLQTQLSVVLGEMSVSNFDAFLSSLGDLTTATQKANWQLFNQKLREKFATQKVLLSCYTYDPFYGITSESDQNNNVIYNEYDELGRLKLVRDDDNNILKTYHYNYRQ